MWVPRAENILVPERIGRRVFKCVYLFLDPFIQQASPWRLDLTELPEKE